MNEVCVVPGCGREAWFHAGRMLLCKAHVVSVVAASKAETEPAPADEGAEAYRAAVMAGAETGDRTPDLRFTNPEASRRCAGERTDDQGGSWWACTKDVGHAPPHEDVNGIKWQGPGWMTRQRARCPSVSSWKLGRVQCVLLNGHTADHESASGHASWGDARGSEGSPPSPGDSSKDFTQAEGGGPKDGKRSGEQDTRPPGGPHSLCDAQLKHYGPKGDEAKQIENCVMNFGHEGPHVYCLRCGGFGVALVDRDGGTRSMRGPCPKCQGRWKTRCADESPSGYLCMLGEDHEGEHRSAEGGTWGRMIGRPAGVEPVWFALQDLGEYGEKWQWSEVERLSSTAAAIRGEIAGIRKAAPADHLCVSALELPASTKVGRYFVWCDLENRWLEVTACLMTGRALPLREHITDKGPEELGRIIERLVELGLVAKVKA